MYYVFCQRRKVELNGTDEKQIAEIAQLVEHHLAKVGVASSSLVFRSISFGKLLFLNSSVGRAIGC